MTTKTTPKKTTAKPKKESKQVLKDLSALSESMMKIHEVAFDVDGQEHVVRVRALTWKESSEVDNIRQSPIPPKVVVNGREEYDFQNVEYLQKFSIANRKSQVFLLEKGLVDIEFEGETLEEKVAFVEANLPARFVTFFEKIISDLSESGVNILERANFT